MPDVAPAAPPPSVVDASVAQWLPGDANDEHAARAQSRTEARTTGDLGGAWSAPALHQALVKQFPDVVEAYHAGSDQFIKADPALIEHGFRQGQVTFRADQTLHVQRPDGSIVPVAGAAISDELNAGGHIASPRAARDQELAQKVASTGGAVSAGIRGAARGASTALLGIPFTDLGLTAPEAEEAAALKEGHPLVSGLTEAGGMLAAAAATGGGLAGAAEEGAAAGVGKGLAGRLATHGVRGAVEMAELAHTDLVSEEALGGPELTAEKYWSTIGKEALGGAVLGAGGAGVSELLGAGRRAVVGALTKRATAADLEGVAAKAAGGYKPGGVGEALVKIQSVLSGADAEGTEAIRNAGVQNQSAEARALRQTAQNIAEVRAGAVKDITENLGALVEKTDAVTDELKGATKREHLKALVNSPLGEEIATHANESVRGVQDEVEQMLADRVKYGHSGDLKALQTQLDGFSAKMTKAVEAGDQAEMFALLDDTKREVGKWSKAFQRSSVQGKPLAVMQAKEVFARLGDIDRGGGLYESLRKNLEDEAVWGKAGVSQKAFNAAWTDYIAAQKGLSETGASVTTKVGERNFGQGIYKVDQGKVEKYVGGLINPHNDLQHQAMANYIQAAKRLAGAVDDHLELPPAKQAAVSAVKANAILAEKSLADIGVKLAKVNQIKMLTDAGRGSFGALYGHMLGGAVGGGIGALVSPDDRGAGAAVGGMLGMGLAGLSNPGKNIMRLAQIESVLRTADEKMGGAVARFFSRGERAAVEAEGPGLGARAKKAAQTVNRGRQESDRDATRREYERRVAALTPMSDLDAMHARMAPHYERLQGSAPKTASALGQTAATVVGYALSKLPGVEMADPLTGKPGEPSYSEMATFNRRMETLEDPDRFAEDFEKGRITTDQVDAYRNAFPARFEELQGKVQQALLEHAQAGKPVPFQQRVTLGMLLDIETDPSLSKPSMAHATATYATAPMPPDKPPGNGGRKGNDASSRGNAMMTPAQRLGSAM